MKYIGFIIAAGKQTRFKSETPKSLMKINDKTILEINLSYMLSKLDEVNIVIPNGETRYDDFVSNNVHLIHVTSGGGCGHAVYQALCKYQSNEDYVACIKWGDSIHMSTDIYDRMKNASVFHPNELIMPVTMEQNPYVRIYKDNDGIDHVEFSKYGEITSNSGLHDQSIFMINGNILKSHCEMFEAQFGTNDELIFNHKHGNEFTFLDLINNTGLKVECLLVSEKHNAALPFNTLEEFEEICRIYNDLENAQKS